MGEEESAAEEGSADNGGEGSAAEEGSGDNEEEGSVAEEGSANNEEEGSAAVEGSADNEGEGSAAEEGAAGAAYSDEDGAVDDSNIVEEPTDDAAEQPQPYGEEDGSEEDETGDDYVDSQLSESGMNDSGANDSGPNESRRNDWGDYTAGTPDYESIENEFAKKTNEGGQGKKKAWCLLCLNNLMRK